MLNAEDILLLEKRWLKYKIKKNLFVFLFFICIFLAFMAAFYAFKNNDTKISTEPKQVIKPKPSVALVEKKSETKTYAPIVIPTVKKTNKDTEKSDTPITDIEKKELKVEKKNAISYHLKLQPTLKGNDLFSSNYSLELNVPKNISNQPTFAEHTLSKIEKEKEITKPIQENKTIKEPTKLDIKISATEVDTVKYLKEKFYSTENIVFAIMLCEEYFNNKNYQESIKWALTANEIDSKSDKSWYWFAKNKVMLGQKDDAIKALESFLANNNSRRLKELLKQIKYGDY